MVTEVNGEYVCDGCDQYFTTANQAEKHEFDCPELAGFFRKFISWWSKRFVSKYGFDRRKSSTKLLEFLYFRYMMDYTAMIVSGTIIAIRLLLIFEVEGVPLSGSMPYSDETLLTIGISGYILQGSYRKIREFKLKVIDEIPKLTKELGTTQSHKKKNT